MDEMYGEDMMEPQGGFKIWYVIVPVVIVVIGAVVFFVIRRKKKKKAQELLELESELEDLSEVDVTEANLIKTVEPEPKEEEESKEE